MMVEALTAQLAEADDETLRGFQAQLVGAHKRLYTWRHGGAAEMICGFISDDVFTDWRSWVIALGRETFERVAEDPDNLADVQNLWDGCEGVGESFGAAVADIYHERHGYEDEQFAAVEPSEPPSGERLTDLASIRTSLPRLSARIPNDGLGQGPGSFAEDD
jgi:hypothetical protein